MRHDALALQTAWLRSFLAVVDSGGFGAATVPLHLSQSRVSAHIAALERSLGVNLFDRTARPTITTEAGELFRNHALAALRELQRGVDAARSTLEDTIARATIASCPSVSTSYLPAVLHELHARHPGLTVELLESGDTGVEELVATAAVDVAFAPVGPRMHNSDVSHRCIWREDIVAVMLERDPLAARRAVGVDDLLRRPLIGNTSPSQLSGDGLDLREVLGDPAEGSDVSYSTSQPATLAALVRSELGVGLISRTALDAIDATGLAVRRIDSPTAHREVAVFWQRRRSGNSVVKALLDAQAAAAVPTGVRGIHQP